MEQRRLRLGDILDDYCPRERRVTNHAVVAMIEEDVKQTRCTTCDTEHAYKGARVPKRRKKETPAALYKEVLAAMPETDNAPILDPPVSAMASTLGTSDESPQLSDDNMTGPTDSVDISPYSADFHPPMHSDDNDPQDDFTAPTTRVDEDTPSADGPVHRPLIRATLPRPEGQKDTRPVPEFTVRHAPPRGNGTGGTFRGDRTRMRAGTSPREPNGNRAQNSGQRFQGQRSSGSGRQPMNRGGSSGFRNGNGGPSGKRGRGPRG